MKTHWPDCCHHDRPRDRFLGTFEHGGDTYDVHVYQDNALAASIPDMHVCIRYGSEGREYISPGDVAGFLDRAERYSDGVYVRAARMVREYVNARP